MAGLFEAAESFLTKLKQSVDWHSEILTALKDRLDGHDNALSDLDLRLGAAEKRIEQLSNGGPVDPPTWTPAFPGDVPEGKVRWGAAIDGNGDPGLRHEETAEDTMGLRRTFFAWHHIASGYLMSVVNGDHAAGRLPWVSVKTPRWDEVANGAHDSVLDDLLLKLAGTGKTVWLTVWHEPENDLGTGQTPATWSAMQHRVRARMNALGVENVAFAGILMSWTFDPRSNRDSAAWLSAHESWDFIGIDHYLDKVDPVLAGSGDEIWSHMWPKLVSYGRPVAFGEWGNRGTNAEAAAEMRGFFNLGVRPHDSEPRIVGISYFDSALNSPTGAWSLAGQPLVEFRNLMRDPRALLLDET